MQRLAVPERGEKRRSDVRWSSAGWGGRDDTRGVCDFIGAQLGVDQATGAGSFQGAAALAGGGWALQRAEYPAKSSALPARARRRYGKIGGAAVL